MRLLPGSLLTTPKALDPHSPGSRKRTRLAQAHPGTWNALLSGLYAEGVTRRAGDKCNAFSVRALL
jgi:hypothetical protein